MPGDRESIGSGNHKMNLWHFAFMWFANRSISGFQTCCIFAWTKCVIIPMWCRHEFGHVRADLPQCCLSTRWTMPPITVFCLVPDSKFPWLKRENVWIELQPSCWYRHFPYCCKFLGVFPLICSHLPRTVAPSLSQTILFSWCAKPSATTPSNLKPHFVHP